MTSPFRRILGVVAALTLSVTLAGCNSGGSQADETRSPDSSTRTDEGTGSGNTATDDGNDGRAFDASDDTIIKALSAAISDADEIYWDGKSVMLRFNEGSAEDPTAGIGCLAAMTIIADDEKAFMVYADGEIDCSERY